MKTSKISPQLITNPTASNKGGYTLPPDELQRLADFISLLAAIDRRNKTKAHHHKENGL